MSKYNKNGSLAIISSSRPSVQIIDPITKAHKHKGDVSLLYSSPGATVRFSRDGKHLARSVSSPYIAVVNIEEDIWVSKLMTTAGSTVQDISFSDSIMLCAVSAADKIAIYDAITFDKLANPTVLPGFVTYGCDISPDGSIAVLTGKIAPHIVLYNTADWSVIPNPSTVPVNDAVSCHFSPDGAFLAMACLASPFIYVYDTSDWSLVTIPVKPTVATYAVRFNNSSTRLAVVSGSTSSVSEPIVYDTSDWSRVAVPAFNPGTQYITTGNWNDVTWVSDDVVVGVNAGFPSILYYNLSNQSVEIDESMYSITGCDGLYNLVYEVNGTIDESLVADTWLATVADLKTGSVLNIVEFTGASFSVGVPTPDPVTVTISAKQGDMWQASLLNVDLGTMVFPTDPITSPYYYIVTIAGGTGVTEPVWPVGVGGTVVDGTVTWQRVERLITPVTQSPLIPTVSV